MEKGTDYYVGGCRASEVNLYNINNTKNSIQCDLQR